MCPTKKVNPKSQCNLIWLWHNNNLVRVYLQIGPIRAIFVLRVQNYELSAIWRFSTLFYLTLKHSNFVHFKATGLIEAKKFKIFRFRNLLPTWLCRAATIKSRQIERSSFFLLDHNDKTRIYRLVSGSFDVPLRRKHDSPMVYDDCAPSRVN